MTDITPGAVSLDDLLRREIHIEWDEGVAVVEELCGLLTAARGAELPVPELIDILITADGAVALRPGARGQQGASGAGRTLHALLSTAHVPVALRLFVTHSTSPEAYASIRKFAEALAYFGKPGRSELIRELYQRCPSGAASSSKGSTSRRATLPTEQPRHESPVRSRRTRLARTATAASLVGGGILLWSLTGPHRTTSVSLPTLISETTSAIRKLGTEVGTRLGVGTTPVGGDERAATDVAPPTSRLRATTSRRTRNERSPIPPLQSRRLVLPRHDLTVTVVPPVDPRSRIDFTAPANNVVAEDDEPPAIYSSSDADVRPPVLLFPQMPPPMVDRDPAMLNRMELVVSASGTVEHVRLVAGPNRMTDMMLLSGAKMWRFEPAVKDGEPVRYRTVVSWIGGP